MNHASDGEPSNLWVTAKTQTSARGSRGRDWKAEPGNLFASLMLRDAGPVEKLYQLTFVAAISVGQAIRQFSNSQAIENKWPNDLLLNGKKCSGILLESRMEGDQTIVVIGIGVNCISYPDIDTLHAATSLAAEEIECAADELFPEVAICMANNISIWDKGNNFAAIRSLWLKNAYGLGKEMRIKIPGQAEMPGVFLDMDENGLLILGSSSGETHKISTADIFFNQT